METEQSYCAPKIAANKQKSCFTYELLVLIATLYNNSHTDKINIVSKKSKKKLWLSIKDKLSLQCGSNETCWLEQPFVKNTTHVSKLEKNFRPKKPASWYKNPTEWLNTYDILFVMKQYEESDKLYKFIGV